MKHEPRIYDRFGTQRPLKWLELKYGNIQMLIEERKDKPVFRLVSVRETEGPAVIQVIVEGMNQGPKPQQPVANHWPDNSLPTTKGTLSRWRDRAHIQYTEPDGTVGFGIGGGSYIRNLDEGGPHTIFVLSPSVYSDGISGVGMLGGTDHMGPLRLTFRLMQQEQTEDPEPEPPEEPIEDPQQPLPEEEYPKLAVEFDVLNERLDRLEQSIDILKQMTAVLSSHLGVRG